jgi:hypothetical protein
MDGPPDEVSGRAESRAAQNAKNSRGGAQFDSAAPWWDKCEPASASSVLLWVKKVGPICLPVH